MSRFLFFIVLFVVIYWWFASRKTARTRSGAPSKGYATEAQGQYLAMVACAHCGLHIPRQEALTADNEGSANSTPSPTSLFYCSEAHRSQGPMSPVAPSSTSTSSTRVS